jgi:predicted lipoprotein with Yx(FWY)xxD motif
MPQSIASRRPTPKLRAAAIAFVALALAIAGSTAAIAQNRAGQPSKLVVKEAQNETLGKTVLTTLGGRTLYSLSAETKGKFICTGSCLASWHPLVVPTGVKPTGAVKLGTIVRPDNKRVQVTYRGRPLYRFDGDSKAGDANGEGIKDVGTWHAATAPKTAGQTGESSPPPQEAPPYTPPYGY